MTEHLNAEQVSILRMIKRLDKGAPGGWVAVSSAMDPAIVEFAGRLPELVELRRDLSLRIRLTDLGRVVERYCPTPSK